jgi:O-antigen/teichoic acid export membrane protein
MLLPSDRPGEVGTNVAGISSGAQDGLSSVTRGTLVMMLGTLGFVAESFISRVILVHLLSPQQWTDFSIGLTVSGLLSALGALGFPSAVARSIPFEGSDRERRGIVRSSFAVVVPGAIAVTGVMAVLSLPISTTFHSPLLGETFIFFAAAVGLSIVAGLIASIFQGYEDVLPNALFVQVLNPSLFIVFLLIADGFGHLGLSFTSALLAYLVAGLVSFLPLVWYTRRKLPRLLPPGDRRSGISPELVKFATPLFVVSVMSYAVNNADSLVLAVFHQSSVGQYSADLSLARLLQVGIGSLGYIILPVTARFVRTGDDEAVRTTYATATKWMVLASLPLFLVFFFYTSRSLAFVYGSSYVASIVPLQLIVLGSFLSTLVGPSAALQVSYGQTRLLLLNTVAAAGVDMGLSFALVPSYGITGAALAWAVANVIYPTLSLLQLEASNGVHPFRRHFVVPLVVTTVPLALLFLFVPFTPPLWTLPLIVLGAAGVFVLAVMSTGSLDVGDQLLLTAVEGMLGRPVPGVRWLGAHLGRFAPPRPGTPPRPPPA